jgi:DNA polymerase-3 subunit delta
MNWSGTLLEGQSPVYLIHGDDTYLARAGVDWLREVVLSGGVADFNLDRFDVRETFDAGRITQACHTLPMMAPKRMVWVRNAEVAFGRSKDALRPLLDYLAAPDSTTCLLFEATCRVKKNALLYKRIAKAGCVAEMETPRERELPNWVTTQTRGRDRQISRQGTEYLVEAVGADLAGLDAALERLSLFVPKPGRIELEHVRECVPHTRTRTVWELIDAVADRNVAKALTRTHQLLDQGKAPLQLLSLVVRQFRQLLVGHDVRNRGGSVSDAAAAAGIPHFRQQQFGRQLDRYSFQELLISLRRIAQTDAALKSSKLPDAVLFEALLLDLCAPRTNP